MILKNPQVNKGFTLIETFGAITILVLAVLGPLSLLSRNISDGALIKDRMTASYLAQEGLELVIGHRNANEKKLKDTIGNPGVWLTNLDACDNPSSCNLDATNPLSPAQSCGSGPCDMETDEFGRYIPSTSLDTPTSFSRKITIEPFETTGPLTVKSLEYFKGDDATVVTVEVRWSFKGSPKVERLSTVIYRQTVQSEFDPGAINLQ